MAQNTFLGSIVPDMLRGHTNYGKWSHCMKTYLVSQGLWDKIIVEANSESPANKQASDHDENWRRKNATALHAILITCAPDILPYIMNTTDSAQFAWNQLANHFGRQPTLFQPNHHTGNENDALGLGTLLKYARKGDWQSMENFLKDHPDAVNVKIAPFGETALHVAVRTNNVEMVIKLVNLMTPEALEIKDNFGNTSFHYVAMGGITEIATHMINKNDRLLGIANSAPGVLAITYACHYKRRELSTYLLSLTPSDVLSEQDGIYGSLFLRDSIKSQMLDITLKALDDHPCLVAAKFDVSRYNALLLSLSETPSIFPSSLVQLGYWQRWIYSSIHIPPPTGNGVQYRSQPQSKLHRLVRKFLEFSGINQIYDLKMMHAYSSILLDRACEYVSELDESEWEENGIPMAFLNAIKFGIVEIIVKMVKIQPRLLEVKDEKDERDIIKLSIVNRHEKIFSLCCGLMGTYQSASWIAIPDKSLNTLLHLAGMISPDSVLTHIPGAALQMQRELQWYKEVESIVDLDAKFEINENNQTPEEVFFESHMQLVKDGEKWMKGTATSYTVVGALIITVMFAAAFTVPGGNVQDIGIPVFLPKKAFKTFIVADAISLFSATTSVLMFLGILTSRYAEQDFLKSLPTKLIIGVSMLFISITTMMVAFCAALIVTLDKMLEIVILIVVLACVPVILFMSLQLPLLVEMVKSTYGPGIFDRKMKI